MSPTGVLFIALVVVMSGLLAYLGDLIGRRFGKKRHTFGRLRPRHTAALFTALFGMLASGLTIGILMGVSTPVRVMLLEGDRLSRQIDSLDSRLRTAINDLRDRQSELDRTRGQVRVEKANVVAEQIRLARTRHDLEGLRKLADNLASQARQVRSQLASVRSQLAVLKPQYDRIKVDFDTISKQKNYAESEYAKISQKNLNLVQEASKLEGQVDKLNGEITDLKKASVDLQRSMDDKLQRATEDLRRLQSQVNDANFELEQAKKESAALKAFIEGPGMSARMQPLIFARGDELARTAVRSNLSKAEARNYVLAILSTASEVAAQRGAKPSTIGGDAAVLPEYTDNQQRPLTRDQQIDALVEKLAGKDTEQVVLADALFNAFREEAVPLALFVRPNPVVYKLGQVIVETRVDGTKAEEDIVSVLSKFIEEELGPRAVRDGMIPAVGHMAPLGEISPDRTLALVREIKGSNRTIRVQFLAAQETRAADQLKIEFRLR